MGQFVLVIIFQLMINTNDLRKFLEKFAAKQVGVSTEGMIDEESPNVKDKTNPDLIKKHQKTINEAFRANYSLVRQLTVRGRYGLGKFLLTYSNEITMLDLVVVIWAFAILAASNHGLLV